MYHSTGLAEEKILDLIVMIYHARNEYQKFNNEPITWPGRFGLFKSVVVVLKYLKRNRVQQELAEDYRVSQPTISRAVTGLTAAIGYLLKEFIPEAEGNPTGDTRVLDGTLCPSWSWKNVEHMYSGKHKTTGWNILVEATLDGLITWISDPYPGAWHDMRLVEETHILDDVKTENYLADKGFQGSGMITPIKRKPGTKLTDQEKEHNKTINQHRYIIEQAIAHLKTWRILHTDYRRPPTTFPDTLRTVIALYFYTHN